MEPRKDSAGVNEKARVKSILGIALILMGSGFYFFNYERQNISVSVIEGKKQIIDYHAPQWDPLPHHLKISAKTSEQVTITAAISDEKIKTYTFQLDSEERTLDIYPNETIKITLENPEAAKGIVKTVLWCDSWNYLTIVFLIGGLIVLFLL